MGFKLKLKGYFDGNSIHEVNTITDGVVVSFEKKLYISEASKIGEKISTLVTPLSLATVRSLSEEGSVIEQPVISITHRKSALVNTTWFSYFPSYKITEYPEVYSTITFENDFVLFDDDLLISLTCTRSRLITTSYTYEEDGDIPVVVNRVDAFLGILEASYTYNQKQATFPISSRRTTMHQLNKNPIPNQGEIGATPQDACVNLGVITRDKGRDFTITSGEPYDLHITDILIPVWMGVEFRGLTIGTVLPAGGSLTFTVFAYAGLGRSDVREFTTIKFDEVVPRYGSTQKVGICIEVHRRQSPDILIIPDKGSYKESIEYSTKEFRSINNIRTTKPSMLNWKYSCKYTVTMHRTDYHKSFLNTLKVGKSVVFQHPLWSQVTLLEQTMASSLFCKCDTAGCDFRVDEWVFIYVRPDEYYLRQVTAIVSEGLMFSRITTAFEGVFVVPALLGEVTCAKC